MNIFHHGCSETGCSETGCYETGCSETGCSETGCSETGCYETGLNPFKQIHLAFVDADLATGDLVYFA